MPKEEKLKIYTQKDVDQAIQLIKSGTSLTSVSHQFGIPKSTLHSKIHNKYPVNARYGPPSILSEEEENYVIQWIFFCCEQGFPIKKEQLLDCVQKYVLKLNKKNPKLIPSCISKIILYYFLTFSLSLH
ncbi:hypothetical protein ALC57_10779 [Trachymyrmex cornetzi]|uniref:HTH psq-type domain-containing protein n=1 Tax=Trachymyrmex cornetzi TaxID=471704 RepID=A0A151J3C0_9HYME|nr:hypothetical protein ALC57_10779 [Trachymyrmex cornetzi]